MISSLRDQDMFDAGVEHGTKLVIKHYCIERVIDILKELSIDEVLIATKIKEKFQLNDDEVKSYLKS